MRINKIKLKNIGPHKELEVNFDRGLIGLIGSNGAGKSTLVNSIYAALTNDFSRFGNSKAEIITNGTKDESFIALYGEHRGQQFELVRWLKPNKNEFVFGNESYSKATDINEAIFAQLNIPKLVIDKYVFVDQWEMFGFLDQSASERAKTFQYLCGTEAATAAYKVCSDYVSKQKNLQIVDNSFELQNALTYAENAMTEHRKIGKSAEKFILEDDEITAHNALVTLERIGLEAIKSLEEQQQEKEKLIKELADYEKQIAELQEKIDKRKKWKSEKTDELIAANALLAAYDECTEAQSAIAKATAALELQTKSLAKLVKPVKKQLYADKDEQRKLTAQQAELQLLIKQASNACTDEAVCPHCLQEVSEDHVKFITATLDKNTKTLNAVKEKLEFSLDYDSKLLNFENKQLSITKEIARLETEIKANKNKLKDFGDGNKEEAEALLAKAQNVEQQLKDFDKSMRLLSNKSSQATGKLQVARVTIAKLETKVAAKPTAEKMAKVQEKLSRHDKAVVTRQTALGAYREAKKSRDRTQATLTFLQEKLAQQVKIQNLLDTISEAGEVFHWNNLPKIVSQANLELLVTDINNNLQLFGNPFVVEADQDLTFKVFFSGQLPVKARQLSGGQKVILAIAFRAALDRVFGHDTGMMYLDEPTAGLDADNVKYFHEALQKLAEKSGTDRQLVVITHVHELSGVFDQLIQL
jgi:exonuclease SbcC